MMLTRLAPAAILSVLSLSLTLAPSPANAFTDTSPLLVFSHASGAGDIPLFASSPSSSGAASKPFAKPHHLAKELVKGAKVCRMDAVAILTSSDSDSLRSHPSGRLTSFALETASGAPHFVMLPHVLDAHGSAADEMKKAVLRTCKGWSVVDADELSRAEVKDKVVVRIDEAGDPQAALEAFAARYKNNVVALTTRPAPSSSHLIKRAAKDGKSSDSDAGLPYGLFAEYQFFTSGLILLILIFGIILLPGVKIATSLLASIETPDRMGDSKMSGPGKDKNQ